MQTRGIDESFESLKQQAVDLWDSGEYQEVARHAQISLNNRHSCRDCFCCACLEVWRSSGKV